jgi:hypothetical protein
MPTPAWSERTTSFGVLCRLGRARSASCGTPRQLRTSLSTSSPPSGLPASGRSEPLGPGHDRTSIGLHLSHAFDLVRRHRWPADESIVLPAASSKKGLTCWLICFLPLDNDHPFRILYRFSLASPNPFSQDPATPLLATQQPPLLTRPDHEVVLDPYSQALWPQEVARDLGHAPARLATRLAYCRWTLCGGPVDDDPTAAGRLCLV